MDLNRKIADETGLSVEEVTRVCDSLLVHLHKNMIEHKGLNGDYIGESAHRDLSERSFYHLLGFLEQFATRYSWDRGSISEYLGRLPPVDRWKKLSAEMGTWRSAR